MKKTLVLIPILLLFTTFVFGFMVIDNPKPPQNPNEIEEGFDALSIIIGLVIGVIIGFLAAKFTTKKQ